MVDETGLVAAYSALRVLSGCTEAGKRSQALDGEVGQSRGVFQATRFSPARMGTSSRFWGGGIGQL